MNHGYKYKSKNYKVHRGKTKENIFWQSWGGRREKDYLGHKTIIVKEKSYIIFYQNLKLLLIRQGENITKHISNKELLFRMYKEFLQLNYKKAKNTIKQNGQNI